MPQDAFVDFNGLRFSHFSLKREAGDYSPSPFDPNEIPNICSNDPTRCEPSFSNAVEIFAPDPNPIGISLSSGVFASPSLATIKILPYGTQWMFIGSHFGSSGLGVQATNTKEQRLTLGFQVDTIDPNARLNKLVLGMSGFMGGFFSSTDGRLDADVYGSAVYVPGFGTFPVDRLGSANMDSGISGGDSGFFANDAFDFNGRQSIYVQTRAYGAYPFSSLNGFVLHFNVVPEPASAVLIAVCLGLLSMPRRRVVRQQGKLRSIPRSRFGLMSTIDTWTLLPRELCK